MISPQAEKLHETMLASPEVSSFTQEDLQGMSGLTEAAKLLLLIQELLNNQLIKLVKQGDVLKFQPVQKTEASKISKMTKDEAMVYSYIEASGREGIWSKTIKGRTNLHQHIVLRCLKSLESQSFIKSVKSVKHPTRKIYMLYHLTPSIDVTGGPWFTDSELDTEFIDSLLAVVWRFVASKSFPNCFSKTSSSKTQETFPATFAGYPSLNEIMEFIISSGITNVELTTTDLRSLCDVLVHDGKIDRIENTYKATWQSVLEAGGGVVAGEDPYAVQDDVMFNIFDNYRVAAPFGAEGDKDILYLDSWINT